MNAKKHFHDTFAIYRNDISEKTTRAFKPEKVQYFLDLFFYCGILMLYSFRTNAATFYQVHQVNNLNAFSNSSIWQYFGEAIKVTCCFGVSVLFYCQSDSLFTDTDVFLYLEFHESENKKVRVSAVEDIF